LTERNGGGTSVPDELAAARAAELLRLLQAPPPRLPSSVRARIAARLAHVAPATGGQRRMLWPAAGAATLVLFAGGAVGATWGIGPAQKLFGRWMRSESSSARVETGARPATPAIKTSAAEDQAVDERPVSAALAAPKTLATTVIEPEAARPLALEAPRRHKSSPSVSVGVTVKDLPSGPAKPAALPQPAEEPAGDDNSIVAESRLLADALTLLRQRREPARALRALDAYERRFPAGALAPEASAARIDALLELGRRGQALERLDALALDRLPPLPRAAELRVLRGELRAGGGSLAGAVSDFTAALGMTGAPSSVIERALYGRGSSRARLGDTAGARADLQDYLRRFPRGHFAGPAGRALRD
jgi:hypothetical protein